jgi:hypothetical protein
MVRNWSLTAFALGFGLVAVGCVAPGSPDESIGSEPSAQVQGAGKVTICHIPSGNAADAHSIDVSASALNAHLAHGDSIGDCDGGEEPSGGGEEPSGGGEEPTATSCSADGTACSADADCCNGVCGGSGACVSQCNGSDGGIWDGVACSESSDCCAGASCVLGTCYEGLTCHLAGTACDAANENDWCCFGLSCVEGTCK